MTVQLLTHNINNFANKFLLTTQQYHLMYEAGVFSDDDRLELINGEIKTMSPIGKKHVACIIRLVKLFEKKLGDRFMVSPQNSIRLNNHAEPQPDIAILKWRDDFYTEALPTSDDILLIIEVADSTIAYDREVKAPLYAANGIPEMWLFDVNKKAIEGYSQPSANGYKLIRRYDEGDTLSMLAFPDVTFIWKELC
jgi:Uma2 family endonuclease